MTKLKTTPAEEPSSVDEATALVSKTEADIRSLKVEIAHAEAQRDAQALNLSDEAFEAAVLETERKKRRLLKSEKSLEAAEARLAEAKVREEEDQRNALIAAGVKAAEEIEKLLAPYAEHASAIAAILRKIEEHRAPIAKANETLHYGERLDDYALGIHSRVDLPATTKDGDKFWWRIDYYGRGPLDPPPEPREPASILVSIDGAFVKYDASNPAHVEAYRQQYESPSRSPKPPAKAAILPDNFGEIRPDGTRVYKAPKCDWPGAVRN